MRFKLAESLKSFFFHIMINGEIMQIQETNRDESSALLRNRKTVRKKANKVC